MTDQPGCYMASSQGCTKPAEWTISHPYLGKGALKTCGDHLSAAIYMACPPVLVERITTIPSKQERA